MCIRDRNGPAADEELVCVTENDACGVDAVQVITGCTMGKGNLLYRGTGKMAFSFYCRNSGASVRLCLKALQMCIRDRMTRAASSAAAESKTATIRAEAGTSCSLER